MSFDGLVMSAVKAELQEKLIGGRIEKIYQPLAGELTIMVHNNKEKFRLLLSADARDARVHLTHTVKENPLTPPMFCMVLRKHLEGSRIIAIEQLGLERVLKITADALDELGRMTEKHLLCEVMGKHSNIILVDSRSNVILDGIKRYSYGTSRHREVLPGRQYVPPPETGKLSPPDVDEDTFRHAVWAPEEEYPVDKLILQKFEGFSPQTCREIAVRAGLDPEQSSQGLGELDLQRLWGAFRQIIECVYTGSFTPVLCFNAGRPTAFSAVRMSRFTDLNCKTGTMNDVLDEFFSTRDKQERLRRAAAELLKVIKNELKKVQKKISIHQEILSKTVDSEKLKITGELITANIYQIPARAKTVELIDYYDPSAKTVAVELDPQLTAAANAQAYFKRYSKARSGQAVAKTYVAEAAGELAYLESVFISVEQAEKMSDLLEIKAELIKEGYLKPPQEPKKGRKTAASPEPEPIKFNVEVENKDWGLQILVGRNNRQNDYLTLKLAMPDDLWLHVKDIPGSHVIVRNPQKNVIPDHVIEQAASLAAYYSKARQSTKAPVDYTLRKHVRKPKGAKPGMVIYENQKTVYVEPKSL